MLKSERDEYQYKYEKLLKADNAVKSRAGQLKLYQNMKAEIKDLREKCRKLELDNSKLLQKVVRLNAP